jgi:hypothetical protein
MKGSKRLDALLFPEYRCPEDASGKCSLSRFQEYRMLFRFGGVIEVRSCIPSRDNKVEVNFQ